MIEEDTPEPELLRIESISVRRRPLFEAIEVWERTNAPFAILRQS